MSSLISNSLHFIKKIFLSAFGALSWTPPYWISSTSARLSSVIIMLAISYLKLLDEKPRRFLIANLLVAGSIIGSVYGYRWYLNQPKPSTISLKINNIEATRLDVEKTSPNPLIIEFSGSAATIEGTGKEIKEGIEVSPPLSGIWRWTNDSRLEFQPAQDWEVGQNYSVKLSRNLFPSHILLEKYKFDFYSPKFSPTLDSGEFYEDPTNPSNKQGVVKIKFTHPVDKSDLERRTRIRLRVEPVKSFDDSSVKKLGFKIIFNENATEAYIRSDLLTIPEKDAEMLFEIEPGLRSLRGGRGSELAITRTIHVPGVENYFKISAVSQNIITREKDFSAERIITISSTAGVAQSELSKNVEVLLIPHDQQIYRLGMQEQEDPAIEEESEDAEPEYQESEESDSSEESSYQPDLPQDSCPWSSAGQVPEQAIKAAKPLNITWIASEKEFSSENSFKFEAETGHCIFLRIKKGTKAFGDFPLVDTRSFVQIARPFPQDLRITDKGAVLALSGERKINIMARGLKAVKFTLFRVLPNALHHLSTQGFQYDATFQQPEFSYNFGPENISEVFESVSFLPQENPGKPQYTVFDFGKYLDAHPSAERGVFFLKAAGFDPDAGYNAGPRSERLVLVSNIAFLIKDFENDSHQAYVLSTSRQEPINAAIVEVLGKNGQPVFSGTTDELGKVDMPSFRDFQFEKTPALYVVRKDGDLSFMPFRRQDRKLNFSRFEVGGLYTEKASESLQAYIFSDRGIYRPGETAMLGITLKSQNWSRLPDDIPFELSILDPRGVEIKRQKLSFPPDGFREFSHNLPESALTGNYSIQLSLSRPKKASYLLGSANIRVEEFLPDRLKINASLSQSSSGGWLTPQELKLHVMLRNLYGTPAQGNTIRSRLKLSPALPRFGGWEEFSFYDPFTAKNSFSEDLGEVISDDKGEATIDLGLERFEKATYQLSTFIQGMEKDSGRFVATNVSALVSPQTFLIGWKPGGDLSFIKKNFEQKVKVVAIDQNLKSTAADNLVIERVEERYVSILAKQPGGSLAYQSVKKKIIRDTKPLSLPAGGLEISLPADEPGSYYYEIRDAHGLILNTIPFTIVGTADLQRSMERNAELQIKLNKQDFSSEEEIEFEVQAPYTGMGLATIERDKVYSAIWFRTDTTSSIQRIKVPAGIEGNAYLNVAFVRSLDSREIFTSPLSYGVEPFSISRERRTEKIKLSVPDRIMPGEELRIEASASGRTRAVIYAIDEGILQVARYKTPDPLSHFFRKRALEVQTQQIVDLLLPEYHLARELSAAGGDEDALLGKHRNPFKRKGQKPVIFWSGITDLDENIKSFSFNVPDYFNGSVRVFAVAVSDSKIGVTEDQVTIQGDIVISPNAPLFAAPGDEFIVSAVVANTKLPDGDFTVSLQSDAKIQLLSESSATINIPAGKDAVASFRVKAMNLLGNSNLIFRAGTAGASALSSEARYTIDLSIRPGSARLRTIKTGVLKAGLLGSREATIALERKLFSEESEGSISFSTLPLPLISGLSRFLEEYPHGCTEQITSQAFPALLFSKDPAFRLDSERAEKTMLRAFSQQGARQREDGSFGFWPGDTGYTAWLNLHVFRFILEARERGFAPPRSLIENSNTYLRNMASDSAAELSLDSARNRAVAIYLLTRNGEVTTNYLQTLKEQLEKSSIDGWREDLLTLFMASSYKMLQLDKDAERFAGQSGIGDSEGSEPFYAKGSRTGLYLDLISRHFPEKAHNIESSFFEKIAESLAANSYSTIISANLMLGIESYQRLMKQVSIAEAADLYASSDGSNFAPLVIPSANVPAVNIGNELQALRIAAKSDKSIFYQISQSGFDVPDSVSEISQGLEVKREFRNANGESISEANLGDDVTVVIGVRSKDGYDYINNVAITDLLPSALEISGGTQGLNQNQDTLPNKWAPQFVDAREDRALIYGNVSNRLAQFSYKTKAVSRGRFAIPPVQAEAMYDAAVRAVSGKGVFVVN